MATDIIAAVLYGLSLGVQYNPLFAIFGATIAAAIAGVPYADARRITYAGIVLFVAWLLGDGLRIMGRTQDAFFNAPTSVNVIVESPTNTAIVLVMWALLSFGIGYVAPTWAGAFAGSHVTRGTGWLTAIAVSVAVSLALSVIVATTAG